MTAFCDAGEKVIPGFDGVTVYAPAASPVNAYDPVGPAVVVALAAPERTIVAPARAVPEI